MAKNMAFLSGGIVERILWCPDREEQTDTLVHCCDRPVAVGDTYRDGCFYRNGAAVQTLSEEMQLRLEEADQIIAELVEIIYETDMEVIG